MSSYRIPLKQAGQIYFEGRDQFVDRAVCFLVDRIGVAAWKERRQAIESRLKGKLECAPGTVPVEGISLRERHDEIGWYLYLAEQSIADPPSLETDQASRVLPYLNAIGRNLDALLRISNIETRFDRLVRLTPNQDPDQGIFELLVGARYVSEGWEVEAVNECQSQTPDFFVKKEAMEFDVECKRLARRSDYTDRERDAWLNQWQPARMWLASQAIPLIITISFHTEVASLPKHYVLKIIQREINRLISKESVEDQGTCTIHGYLADLDSIHSTLATNWVKCSSSRERQVITGQHRPDFGITYSILGSQVTIGSESNKLNTYWKSIDFVTAAYWRCDAEASVDTKARNIMTRLSGATGQLTGARPGIVHIGIEASEGDHVEVVRSEKIDMALSGFNPKGKPLEWVFLHYFKGDAPPDELWLIDETHLWRRMGGNTVPKPLSNLFLVLPSDADSRDGVHWAQR